MAALDVHAARVREGALQCLGALPNGQGRVGRVYADHSQFYLVDTSLEWRADLVWDGPGFERRVGVTDGFVAVGTIGC